MDFDDHKDPDIPLKEGMFVHLKNLEDCTFKDRYPVLVPKMRKFLGKPIKVEYVIKSQKPNCQIFNAHGWCWSTRWVSHWGGIRKTGNELKSW